MKKRLFETSRATEAFRLLDSPALMPLSLCSKAPLPIALPAPEVTVTQREIPTGVLLLNAMTLCIYIYTHSIYI